MKFTKEQNDELFVQLKRLTTAIADEAEQRNQRASERSERRKKVNVDYEHDYSSDESTFDNPVLLSPSQSEYQTRTSKGLMRDEFLSFSFQGFCQAISTEKWSGAHFLKEQILNLETWDVEKDSIDLMIPRIKGLE